MVEFVQKTALYRTGPWCGSWRALRRPEGGAPGIKRGPRLHPPELHRGNLRGCGVPLTWAIRSFCREELGDVLLQVALHCQMEAERGAFDFDEVCNGICQLSTATPRVWRCGRSHPDEALRNWDNKNAERAAPPPPAGWTACPPACPP